MNSDIKTIEDLSLNAWPSHQIELYDGWLLRFSYFYTHRTNCVEQIGPSTIPLEEKIRYCESAYRRWGTPVIFKISPLLPSFFDTHLEANGYRKEHAVDNMTLLLPEDFSAPADSAVTLTPTIPNSWIRALFSLKHTTNPHHRRVVPSMYHAIPKETICASITNGREIIATGLGILDRDYIGVYAIHVHPDYRRRGYAEDICRSILAKGQEKGATHAYLQTEQGNEAAHHLYHKLGFTENYACWFRCKA